MYCTCVKFYLLSLDLIMNISFSSVLEECKWTPERVEFLLKKFEACILGLVFLQFSSFHILDF